MCETILPSNIRVYKMKICFEESVGELRNFVLKESTLNLLPSTLLMQLNQYMDKS